MDDVSFSHTSFIKIWSSALFLVPFATALYFGMYVYGLIVFITMITSVLFHYYERRHLRLLDRLSANLLIISNLYLCYLFGFAFPYFPAALAFVIIAFYFYLTEKGDNAGFRHTMWHLSSVVITSLCILGYGLMVLT